MIGWRHLVVVVLTLLLGAAPAWADGHVAATRTILPTLPTLPGGAGSLLIVAGQPVVVRRDTAVALRSDGSGWEPVDARALGDPDRVRLVSGGGRTVALNASRAALVERAGAALRLRPLPPLPEPLRQMVVAVEPGRVTLAGIGAGGPVLLLLPIDAVGGGWSVRRGWPGGGAPIALGGQAGALYLSTDNGAQWRWAETTGWHQRAPAPGVIVPGSAQPIAQSNLLYLVRRPEGETLYGYNGVTDAWAALGVTLPAAASATPMGNGYVVMASGAVSRVELQHQRRALGWLDWSVVGVYLAAMLAIGFWFWRKSRMGSTSEFFLGSRAIPFWAAGVSMFAGNTSSISYLAVPAKAFDTDWQYMMSKIVTVVGLVLVAFWVIPLFRRLNLVSVFSYLETRFHPVIRMVSSALAITMHVGGRMGVVLFLPALAIGTITGTSVTLCILVIGICTIVYTALGGMKAVIWTDFFQVVVLMGGALFAIGFMIHAVGLSEIVATARQFDKTHLVNTSFDFTTPTIWGFIILITFDTVLTFPKDQVLMQRALSTPSPKAASRSVWTFAAILLPGGLIFYVIGTTLFAYYRANPARLDPLLPVDAVFPAFIGTELPHGVTGIIIAGLFAAAMGTLSGTINSVATLLSVDFYQKLAPTKPTGKQEVRFAEWMTVLVGVVGIVIAIVLSRLDVRSLLDLTIELFGLLGGSCAGSYTLGMFTTRANWQGVIIGIVAASLITLAAWVFGLVHPYFYLAIAIVASIVIGYLASLLFPPPGDEQLRGLTIFTGDREADRRADREAEASTSVF